ncbi:EamA family transporter RarD [soil metagenome]
MTDEGGHAQTGSAETPPPDSGFLVAVGCYTLWGLLPLYFGLVQNVSPVEVVAQRVVWSLLLVLALIAMRTGMGAFIAVLRDRRLMLPLATSAVLIAANWLTYVWAVHNHHVVAASLGYFLNPMVNILLGFIVLKERLRRWQLVAVAIAAIGVAILASTALDTLWISLALAFSFGFYGLIRKVTPVMPIRGLGAETVVLTPVALAYLLWLNSTGSMMFGTDVKTSLLLIGSGAITALPLLLFAMAAQRMSMATLGILQYIAPTLQFLCGVLVFGETLSHSQIAAFALIWIGLILFTTDSLRTIRAARLAVA